MLVEAHCIDTLLLSSPEIPPARVAWLQEVMEEQGVELQRCRIVLETVVDNGEVGRPEGWGGGNGAKGGLTSLRSP